MKNFREIIDSMGNELPVEPEDAGLASLKRHYQQQHNPKRKAYKAKKTAKAKAVEAICKMRGIKL